MTTEFDCHQCGQHKIHESNISTGYGRNDKDEKICFACCGLNDEKNLIELKKGEKICLFFNGIEIINWPSTLKITPTYIRKGRHNIAGTRQDVYFVFRGLNFHGIQYGNNSEIIHIRKIK